MSEGGPPCIFGYKWTVQWGIQDGMTRRVGVDVLPEMWGGHVCTADFVRARREGTPYYPMPAWAMEAFEELLQDLEEEPDAIG